MAQERLTVRKIREVLRHAIGVTHQSVANRADAHRNELTAAPVPAQVEKAEMDELFTFIGDKKTESTSLDNVTFGVCRSFC